MDGLKNLYELCVAKSEKPVAYFLNGGGGVRGETRGNRPKRKGNDRKDQSLE